jgi:hypothetical protein
VLIVDISVTPAFCKKPAFRKKTFFLSSSDFNLPPQRDNAANRLPSNPARS